MKKWLLILIVLAGCASPAADYINADKATWDVFDPHMGAWIDGDKSLDADVKDAMHQLLTAKDARISHAVAAIKS